MAALSLLRLRPSQRRLLPGLRPGARLDIRRRRRQVEPVVHRRQRDVREEQRALPGGDLQALQPGQLGVAVAQPGQRVEPVALPQVAGPLVGQPREDRAEQPPAEGLVAPSMAVRVRAREREPHGQVCRETLTAATSFTARLVTKPTSIGAAEFATCMPAA